MKKYLLFYFICFLTMTGCAQTKNSYNLDFEEQDPKTGLPLGWRQGFGSGSEKVDLEYAIKLID